MSESMTSFFSRCVAALPISTGRPPAVEVTTEVRYLLGGGLLCVWRGCTLALVGLEPDQEEDGSETYTRCVLVCQGIDPDEARMGLYEAWARSLPPLVGWLRRNYRPSARQGGTLVVHRRAPRPGEVAAHPSRVVEAPYHGVRATYDWQSAECRVYLDPARVDPAIEGAIRREAERLELQAEADAAADRAAADAESARLANEAEDRFTACRAVDRRRPGYEW